MTFLEIYSKLTCEYNHSNLWLAPGVTPDKIEDINMLPKLWPRPAILNHRGFVVAERTAAPDTWELCGNYKTPATGTAAPPYAAFPIDEFYAHYLMVM